MDRLLKQFLSILKKENVSQYRICQELAISQSYLNEMLNGKKRINVKYLYKICDYLGYEIKLKKMETKTVNKAWHVSLYAIY